MARYELGNMDLYALAVNGTVMENASFFSARFKRALDGERLLDAVVRALRYHPLFGTRVCDRGGYFLETNDRPVVLTRARAANRPKTFGATTNDYPWRLCYEGTEMCFEWCHALTDGRGALAFLATVLEGYFSPNGAPQAAPPDRFPLEPAFERFFDPSVKPLGQKKQARGFRATALPGIRNGFRCTSHVLAVDTAQLLAVAKKADAAPASLLAPLFSRAVRARLPLSEKNRNVSCGIVVDFRKPMGFETMRNCVLNKVITYTDRMDRMDFPTVCTAYRGMLDLFSQPENIIAGCTDMIRQTDSLYRLRPRWLQRALMKLVARLVKDRMNNIGISYLGKLPFCDAVLDETEAFGFRSWPDIGNCVVAAIDVKGVLYLDVCENYRDKGMVPEFIRICGELGIAAREIETCAFEQAAMVLPGR